MFLIAEVLVGWGIGIANVLRCFLVVVSRVVVVVCDVPGKAAALPLSVAVMAGLVVEEVEALLHKCN